MMLGTPTPGIQGYISPIAEAQALRVLGKDQPDPPPVQPGQPGQPGQPNKPVEQQGPPTYENASQQDPRLREVLEIQHGQQPSQPQFLGTTGY